MSASQPRGSVFPGLLIFAVLIGLGFSLAALPVLPVAAKVLKQPQGGNVIPKTEVTLHVTATGTPVLQYQWQFNGSNIAGATDTMLSLGAVTVHQGGDYRVIITNTFSAATSVVARVAVIPQVPTTSLGKNYSTTSDKIIVQGRASTNAMVTNVIFQLNGGAWQPAGTTDHWTNWTASLPLNIGTNILRAYALNAFGQSPQYVAPIFRVVKYQVLVSVSGDGRVIPNFNRNYLDIGRSYTVVAVPGENQLFANWSGSTNSSSARLTFVMQTNTTLKATFANPFIPVAGLYNGLFFDTNNLSEETAGYFTLTLSEEGKFTAQMLLDGALQSIAGSFDLDGGVNLTVARPHKASLDISLQLDLNGSGQLTGLVSATNAFHAPLLAHHAGFSSMNKATNFAGKYTLATGGPGNPAGYGYGMANVNGSGYANFSLTLSDGTPFSLGGPISAHGDFPVYASLYNGQGSFLAWATLSNSVAFKQAYWFKNPAPKSPNYAHGFILTNLTLLIAPYKVPPAGTPVLQLAGTNSVVTLSNGDLGANAVSNGIALSAQNVVAIKSGPKDNLAVTLSAATGFFNGTFTDHVTKKTVPFAGALFPGLNVGLGYFLSSAQSGSIVIGNPDLSGD